MDGYIRQTLKNWASENQAPAIGRARLLLVAASGQREHSAVKKQKDQVKNSPIAKPPPLDQAMGIYNLPWIWVAHVSLTPIRSAT